MTAACRTTCWDIQAVHSRLMGQLVLLMQYQQRYQQQPQQQWKVV
jgi:hypothetical protein